MKYCIISCLYWLTKCAIYVVVARRAGPITNPTLHEKMKSEEFDWVTCVVFHRPQHRGGK